MKHLKQKLMAATAMLMVSAVMMTTSTYAWFAISTAPEAAGITTTIEGSGAFEIALGDTLTDEVPETTSSDTGDDTTWGASVGVQESAIDIEFPITSDSGTLKVITYDTTGRTNGAYEAITLVNPTSYTDGFAAVTATSTSTLETATTVGSSMLLWLRSNIAVTDATATLAAAPIVYDSEGTAISGVTAGVAVSVAGGDWIPLTAGSAVTLTDASFVANTQTKVEVMVYLEGDGVTNEMMLSEAYVSVGTITFTSATIDAAQK